jgi:hypothetical protein
MVMMMTTTAFTAVATPHALVLTVSHDLLFRQPSFAAALMPPFLFIGSLYSWAYCFHHTSPLPPAHRHRSARN